MRAGQPLFLNIGGTEVTVAEHAIVMENDLRLVLEIASQASVHTVLDKVRNGFLTVRGGHRIGICGTAVVRGGTVESVRYITSLAIRVAKEARGVSEKLIPRLAEDGVLKNTLILAPPGQGKTTLLRDMIRALSNGAAGKPLRVGVADERGELAAVYHGEAQMDLGAHTDVMDACSKADGLMILLRGMNPQVLAMDEITAAEDLEALLTAAGCGVSLLATAHGTTPRGMMGRPLYRRLLEERLFQRFVEVTNKNGVREYRIWKEDEVLC